MRVQSVVDATRLGAWLRSGEGIGWLAAGSKPNSLYRVPFFHLFFWHVCFVIVPFFLSFMFCFVIIFIFFCSRWSSVDVPRTFFCPADHVPDWQPRMLLGTVEARSVNVKKTCHEEVLYLQPLIPPITGGCSEGLGVL